MYQGHFLPVKQVINSNSKKLNKRYERIIPEILRRSGYFNKEFQNRCINFPKRQIIY